MLKYRNFLLLAAVSMAVAASPAYADDYDLWVDGTQITSDNLTIHPAGGGTATFDPDTNTLTLDGVTLSTCYTSSTWYEGKVYSKMQDLTVEVKGTNTFGGASDNYCDAINLEGKSGVTNSLTVQGDGVLNIVGDGYGLYAGQETVADMMIKDVTINMTDLGAAGLWAYRNLTIDGATVTISGTPGPNSYGGDGYSGIALNENGTLTLKNDAHVTIDVDSNGIVLANPADGNTGNIVLESGVLDIKSGLYGVKTWATDGDGAPQGSISLEGGILKVQAAGGLTNLASDKITLSDDYPVSSVDPTATSL